MTLVQFFSILRARWKAMLLVLGLVVVGTGIVNAVWPRSYLSTVAVLVDVKSPDPIAGIIYPGLSSPAYMATQVDMIQSDRVSQQVVRMLKLNESVQMREQWRQATEGQGNFETWLADVLRKSLDVKPSRDSSVIAINYKSPDPKFATALANAYAQAYIDVSLELRVDPARQYGKFFDEREAQLRAKVEQAHAKLTAYQRDTGIVGTDDRLDLENSRLNQLASELVVLQGLGAETSGREAQARNSPGQIQDVITSPLIIGLKVDLSRQESSLKEASQRLGENNPAIAGLKANIAESRSRIDQETARISGGVAVSNTINDGRIAQMKATIEAQRKKVLRLKEAHDQIAVLVADVESAQRAYDSISVRANQTELESHTTQTNLYVLNPASEPIKPSSPRTTLNMLLALFAGTLLAVGVAMLLELFDRRVRSAADVVSALDTPLLGILARNPGGRLFGRREMASKKTAYAPPALPASNVPPEPAVPAALPAAAAMDGAESVVREVPIGEIFRETHRLEADQIEAILAHQREHGMLFGESAIALKMVDSHDVMWALSRQFHYPYALDSRKRFDAELVTATTPFSSVSETFRSIRSQLIRRSEHDTQRRALAVVSADSGDGKTFFAANLAIAFSQLGRRTLLIDGDMRSPRLHKLFGLDNSRGLSSILAGRLSARVLAPVADLPSLFVLPVGVAPPNPLELLESPAFGLLIKELLGKFDHVIIDSPSAIVGADAGVIAARSGAFVSVARAGQTCMASMIELVASLRDTTTLSLGFVLNEH
ncbi:MAG: chain length determinant protein EpsF [Caulobacter sp.]|nr:chain length determinant protein EpsF [Vitreoscilla sp.]